jgi:cobalt-zinc-cadmium efflux system membrane fusion protein
MNTKRLLICLPFLAAVAVACSKHNEPAGHAKDDGHGHGEAHTETKDGVIMCTEHGVPEDACGVCKPHLAITLKPGESAKIRLPASDSAAIAGVETAAATVGPIADAVECYAELAFNQNRLAQITAQVGGIIHEVDAELGSMVVDNQCVAKIWSAAIAEMVAGAVLTHQTLDRERKLRSGRVTSEKDLQQAEAEHRAACQQARTFGFSEEDINRMEAKSNDPVYLDVRAPFAGEIVARTAVRGALVEAGKPMFVLADRSTMWAMLNIPESDLARVKVGQPVELRVESLPGRMFEAKLDWIGAEVDEKSRMARARAEVANPDGILRANMFAKARILTRSAASVVLLPSSAIQRIEGNDFVFVMLEDDLFDARAVRVGSKLDGKVQILEGLNPGEIVAVNHAFPLKSTFLISRLGAGCADD